MSRTRKEWPFLKSVGYVGQTRILLVRNGCGNDITPDCGTFKKEGTVRQPTLRKGDGERDEVQAVGIVSDMEMSAKGMGKYKRDHWSAGNCLHHVLHDTFRKDRLPAKGSKNNLALIRKFAFNILRLAQIQKLMTADFLKKQNDRIGGFCAFFRGVEIMTIKSKSALLFNSSLISS